MRIKETDRSIILHKIDTMHKEIDNPKWKIMLKLEVGREYPFLFGLSEGCVTPEFLPVVYGFSFVQGIENSETFVFGNSGVLKGDWKFI